MSRWVKSPRWLIKTRQTFHRRVIILSGCHHICIYTHTCTVCCFYTVRTCKTIMLPLWMQEEEDGQIGADWLIWRLNSKWWFHSALNLWKCLVYSLVRHYNIPLHEFPMPLKWVVFRSTLMACVDYIVQMQGGNDLPATGLICLPNLHLP